MLLLAQHKESAVSAERIYEKVWKQPMGEDGNTIRAMVSKLRKKLASFGGHTMSRG